MIWAVGYLLFLALVLIWKQADRIYNLQVLNRDLHQHNGKMLALVADVVRQTADPDMPCDVCADSGNAATPNGVMPCPICCPDQFTS